MTSPMLMESELAAASWLRPPLEPEPVDALSEWYRRYAKAVADAAGAPIQLEELVGLLDGLYPAELTEEPQLLEFQDALWLPGQGCLFDGKTGRALAGTAVTRFPRHRQLPFQRTAWVELTRPVQSFQRLEQALWLPRVDGSCFGEWMTEVMGFLWPLLLESPQALAGMPVLMGNADPDDQRLNEIVGLLRKHHLVPLLDQHLPACLQLERVVVPQPSFRLHAGASTVWWQTVLAFVDQLEVLEEREPVEKLWLSARSGEANGWFEDGRIEFEQTLVEQAGLSAISASCLWLRLFRSCALHLRSRE